MTTVALYFSLLVILAISYRLMFGAFTKFSLFHAYFVAHVVAICVAATSFDNGSNYYVDFYYATLLTPFLFMVGGVLAKLFSLKGVGGGGSYIFLENLIVRNQRFLLWLLFAFVIFYVLDVGLKNSAILFAISSPGESAAAMELRMDAMKSSLFGPLTRVYGYARSIFIPFSGAFLTVIYLNGRLSKLIYYSAMVVSVFFCAYSAAKAPVFYYFLSIALAYYWCRVEASSAARKLVVIGRFILIVFFALFLSALLYPLLHGADEGEAIKYALDSLFDRIFVVPSDVAFRYFEIFGRTIDFIGLKGSTLGAFLSGEEKVSAAQLLYGYYFDNQFSDQGLMNAAFFASFYGDFGWLYMVVGVFVTGLIVGGIEGYLRTIPADGIRIAARAVCTLAVMQLVLSDLTSTLFGRGLLTIPIILIGGVMLLVHLRKQG